MAGTHQDIGRCAWAVTDPLMRAYHDEEWGVPLHDDQRLFEYLLLDGAQAGLSWICILRKREGYRRAFAGFQAEEIVRFTEADVDRLMQDSSIVRNRGKILSAIGNAAGYLKVREEFGSFDKYIWQFVDGRPIVNRFSKWEEIPAQTPESQAMSRDLKSRGFKFVGPTICYAFMQGAGLVNDHLAGCFKHIAPGAE